MSRFKNFVKLNNAASRRKIVVFPYAGGSPYAFRDWGPWLAPQVELWALQLPGRASRFGEVCLSDMEAVVEEVLAELPTVVADSEYVLFGHSNGALVAHASTHRLERDGGRRPRHVFLSGKKPPLGERRCDSDLPDGELVEFLSDLGGLPREVVENKDLLELCLPMIRADMKIGESYRPTPQQIRIATQVTVLGGDDDNGTTVELMDGWREFCSAVVRVELLPGDHFFIAPHGERIVSMMKDALLR
jgi:surfactin synthase thioesterase subunit